MNKENMEQKIDIFVDWIKNNKDQIIIFGLIIVFLIALIPLLINFQKQKNDKVLDRYVEIQGFYYSQSYDKTLESCDKFLSQNNKKNNINKLVLFMKANTLYNVGKYKEAEETYKKLIEIYGKDEFVPAFIDGLAYSQENQQKYSEAIENWNKIITDYSANYLVKNAYKSVARCYELLGNYEKAKEFYKIISGMFEKESLGVFAKNRIIILDKK
jgi:tetratricopeptide (TPR) repeat protein